MSGDENAPAGLSCSRRRPISSRKASSCRPRASRGRSTCSSAATKRIPARKSARARAAICRSSDRDFDVEPEADEGARRAALARWLVDKRNPLTWRSIVNRVWQYHFGRGIVDSPNDFGRMGALPTHPELLDWLAAEFRDGPQSIKQLHRLICTSAVYRQSSAGNAEFEKLDGGNQFLWRMNRRRLEAEAVRDSVLAVAGQARHDPRRAAGFRAFGSRTTTRRTTTTRSTIPTTRCRTAAASIGSSSAACPIRSWRRSTAPIRRRWSPSATKRVTPLQSLALLNNKFMVRMAEHFAERDSNRWATTTRERLHCGLATGVWPRADRRRTATLVDYADRHGLANACRLIFNMNEFVFVD